ncbi:LOW QUALITY PROTEIN: uncharacterized protein LOC129231221 [Uloborus diversus]|uniref:LOW QUALITY PROTEIN: uncharacterized protein LOC129231221 n=1 Tax=Uloborus diversus TaxID=327109 RepID=UPI00240A64EE|nr:LOW QUALITY PROTEIN: uncharacterized protein LOC129231221 [Uloborus diversus]
MEICTKWLTTGITFFFMISLVSCFYPEYYIEDSCKQGNETIIIDTTKAGSAGILKATSRPPYKPNKNCKVIIKPPSDQGIVLSIRNVDLRTGVNYEICQDYIKVYHSDHYKSPIILCSFKYDLQEKLSFFTKGSMTFIYHTELKLDGKYDVETGFTFTFTSVYLDIQDCKHDSMFMCNNGRCISKDMTCDGRNNCGDSSDESPMYCDNDPSYFLRITDGMYAFILAIFISLIVLGLFFIVRYKRRRNADTDALTDHDEPMARVSPYEAIHPTGFFICQNPAGPNTLFSSNSKVLQSDEGFSNPCYPTGIPMSPPPYSQ